MSHDVNIKLMNAAGTGDTEAVRKCIAEGADVNAIDSGGNAPLFYAMLSNKIDIITLLLKNGADVNAKDQGVILLCFMRFSITS